ncbi:hypothetical protein V6N11_069580 [Hibiscus sabdariffa]|uniref:Uncharacterized protein n=1 Tax=Hibiscus sabdariffa TaxID=183260 RepID=A0ABR2Q3T0_9ROSI
MHRLGGILFIYRGQEGAVRFHVGYWSGGGRASSERGGSQGLWNAHVTLVAAHGHVYVTRGANAMPFQRLLT